MKILNLKLENPLVIRRAGKGETKNDISAMEVLDVYTVGILCRDCLERMRNIQDKERSVSSHFVWPNHGQKSA